MYVITPTGEVLHFPVARQQPGESMTELFTGTDCSEWVATVPNTWSVTSMPPTDKGHGLVQMHLDEQTMKEAKKRTIWLFGIIPLFSVS